MAAHIRDYNPSIDADAVSEFYNRNHYGPARDAGALTGIQLNLVLAERGVHLFLVAEDRGRIIGTIGYLRVSGRRVSRDDELFAGMFVIDPSYRAGFLAGRLFTTSFSRLLEDGITSLRVEVNPANVKAFPLYVRVGFRSAEALPQPDQDGYIELVSHLPGVVSRLLRDLASDVPLGDVFSSFSWRTITGGRNRSISHGVTTLEGDVVVEYDFTVRGDSIRVMVRMEDGLHIATTINGVAVDSPVAASTTRRTAAAAPRAPRSVTVGEYVAELDADGTLSVRHPGYFGPVYRDALAVVAGRPTAWRRPPAHAPLITEHQGGWMLAWQVDEVRLQKTISIEGDTLTTVVRSDPNHGLVAEPWSSIRGATVREYIDDSSLYRTPNAPGLWPRDVVDFEGSEDPEPFVANRRTMIDAPVGGIRVGFEWQRADSLRREGQPIGRASTTGSELRYAVTLGTTGVHAGEVEGDAFAATPGGIGWLAEPAECATRPIRVAVGSRWAVDTRARLEALAVLDKASASELVVVPDRGITSWTVGGKDVLASPFPSVRTLGPLQDWAAGLWVSTQSARENFEHGVGWGGASRVAYRPAPAEGGEPSWSVDVLDEEVSSLRLTLESGTVLSDGTVPPDGTAPTDGEIVAHLTPKVWGSAVFVAAHPTGWWQLERAARRWFGFARAARIPIGEGRVLSVAADRVGDELLIRSSADSFLVSLISRREPASRSASSWSLSVLTSEAS